MPVQRLRELTQRERSDEANRRLACVLAAIAGATDAGGYMAVHQYTSHMSGIVSTLAGNSAFERVPLILAGFLSVLSFLLGAVCTAVMVNWGKRRNRHSAYAMTLLLEAALLAIFGMSGHFDTNRALFISFGAALLCFSMGLQNAMITKISNAVIRTTHVTGIVTDIGIELGKLIYWNRSSGPLDGQMVYADRQKLLLLSSLLILFFGGGVAGIFGFRYLGFAFTVPLAVILVLLSAVPVTDDLRASN